LTLPLFSVYGMLKNRGVAIAEAKRRGFNIRFTHTDTRVHVFLSDVNHTVRNAVQWSTARCNRIAFLGVVLLQRRRERSHRHPIAPAVLGGRVA